MFIQNIQKINFKGYDARELKGLLLSDKTYLEPMKKALGDLNVDVYTPEFTDDIAKAKYEKEKNLKHLLWGQDYMTVLKGNIPIIWYDMTREHLTPILSAFAQQMKNKENFEAINENTGVFVRGGNFFICDDNGEKKLLIGEKKAVLPDDLLKTIFRATEVIKLPQLDFHLDLGIRPLDKKNVLVSDITLTQKGLKDGLNIFQRYLKTHKVSPEKRNEINKIIQNIKLHLGMLEITLEGDEYAPQKAVAQIVDTLKKANFHPIKVPATYYKFKPLKTEDTIEEARKSFDDYAAGVREKAMNLPPDECNALLNALASAKIREEQMPDFGVKLFKSYLNNFINAFVIKENDELHYITNASLFDEELGITPEIERETGFSTRKMFEDRISYLVKKENIHYLDKDTTKSLFDLFGGIHCLAAEVLK